MLQFFETVALILLHFLHNTSGLFFAMNLSVEYASSRLPSLKRSEENPAYFAAVACLLLLWAGFSTLTALLVVAIFVPGHFGLSDWLQSLIGLWPTDTPMFTT